MQSSDKHDSAANESGARTQFERVLVRLRGMIMEGSFAPHSKLQEVELAKQMDVSRTPVRLALQALAQEGLLLYTPQRGFVVRGYSIAEIMDAVEIRGRLEAMACEMAARLGLDAKTRSAIEGNLAETAALHGKSHHTAGDVETWSGLNGDFHDTLISAAGSSMLSGLIQQTGTVPLSSARVIVATPNNAELVFEYVGNALKMHQLVFHAVLQRDEARARRMMEEHVYQGRERLRATLENLTKQRELVYSRSFRLIDSL